MTLVAHCIGLNDQEIQRLKSIKSNAAIRIEYSHGLTNLRAKGIYDDLLEIVSIITEFKTFEIHLT